MKWVDEREPAVGVRRWNAGFQRPVTLAISRFDLRLRETKAFQLSAGQRVKRKDDAGRIFNFF